MPPRVLSGFSHSVISSLPIHAAGLSGGSSVLLLTSRAFIFTSLTHKKQRKSTMR
ncbi:hypothetical protein BJX68DRAFT_239518 [Aspergillus pseudodeflectus]|uniref:Uncharacterized protein n=1 Tax=Aspergillus pseudodeflectus TaxID=176178 RepID=A0ABR4K5T6_9EURO